MDACLQFIKETAQDGLLYWPNALLAAQRCRMTISEVERFAMENGILPARYQRNRHPFSCSRQLRLFHSAVAVVGCGGLGGYIIEQLARLGVGRIRVIDSDAFEEHNLNRQLLSSMHRLGYSKSQAAAQRIREINPAIAVEPVSEFFSMENGVRMLEGADAAVDAVDSIDARLEIANVCNELEIPFIHGAIAGWFGHVCTVFPGDDILDKIYARARAGQGTETHLGTPAFTPAVIASLQAAEVCKVLLGEGSALRNRYLFVNLLDMEIEPVQMAG